MKLSVRDAARLLGLSETTIYRWVDQGDIPCSMIQHRPLFHRAELLEWALLEGLPVSPGLFELGARTVPLADALARGGVQRVATLDELAALAGSNADRELLRAQLATRARVMFAAIGDELAIPQVRSPIVAPGAAPRVTLCAFEHGQVLDDEPSSRVFVIVAPTVHDHLELLSRLSFALHDQAFRAAAIGAEAGALVEEARRLEREASREASREEAP